MAAKRLSKIAKELNVGISTLVDRLKSKGIDVESSPNTQVEDIYYAILLEEFADAKVEKAKKGIIGDEFLKLIKGNFKKEELPKIRVTSEFIENSKYKPDVLYIFLIQKNGETINFEERIDVNSTPEEISRMLHSYLMIYKIHSDFSFKFIYNKRITDSTKTQPLIEDGIITVRPDNHKTLFHLINSLISPLIYKNTSKILFEDYTEEQNNELNSLVGKLSNFEINNSATIEFSDFQVALLCGGMEEAEPRRLSEIYNKNLKWTDEEKESAQKYITKAQEKYGTTFLAHCLTLPEKPFVLNNVDRVFTQFDRMKNKTSPLIRLAFDKENGIILYYKDKKIEIKNTKDESLFEIDRKGKVNIAKDVKNITATLVLFLKFANNPTKQIMYFGSETGKCSFCNLELTSPISLLYGYGKTCAENNGLPFG